MLKLLKLLPPVIQLLKCHMLVPDQNKKLLWHLLLKQNQKKISHPKMTLPHNFIPVTNSLPPIWIKDEEVMCRLWGEAVPLSSFKPKSLNDWWTDNYLLECFRLLTMPEKHPRSKLNSHITRLLDCNLKVVSHY